MSHLKIVLLTTDPDKGSIIAQELDPLGVEVVVIHGVEFLPSDYDVLFIDADTSQFRSFWVKVRKHMLHYMLVTEERDLDLIQESLSDIRCQGVLELPLDPAYVKHLIGSQKKRFSLSPLRKKL